MLFPQHNGWDPFLQRFVEPSAACAATAERSRSSAIPLHSNSQAKASVSSRFLLAANPAPNAQLSFSRGRIGVASAGSAGAVLRHEPIPQTPEPVAAEAKLPPQTPAELEEESLKLAWRLQQEEQVAFYQAMSATNTPRSAARPDQSAEGGGAPLEGQPMQIEGADDEEDASLQLALRLQQEELRWQQLASRHSMGGVVDDAADEAEFIADSEESEMQLAHSLSTQLQHQRPS